VLVGGSLAFQHRRQLADLAIRNRMAMIAGTTEAADAGALLSYGADFKENVKRLAPLVDRILKGANPATIPVEQVNVFELVVNLRTARALGIELPRTLMLQATRVIE
jgi:putative ABC transport system substrate-binding protein